jgi:hypothetical protein
MLFSNWFYLNDSLLILNNIPKVIDIEILENSIYRTNSAFLYVNGTDCETPENLLAFYAQFKHDNEDEWINLTGDYLNNRWEAEIFTDEDSVLGLYDFRVKFEDNGSVPVPNEWGYLNESLEVLNNPPEISVNLDDLNVGIQPLVIDLTQYESDIEDENEKLIWSLETQTYTYIDSIEIIDSINDTLKIIPQENVSGNEDIELTLTDKDGGFTVKSDITIIIDSTISELTPKVILLTPPDKSTINTLTPTLKWKLGYAGIEIIKYTVILDENPNPTQELETGLLATEYTLETELEDGKTYYWKVLPTNGICLSGTFWFTVDLGFEPIYKVNLTSEKDTITIRQGESKIINLTVKNEGNSIDNFNIKYSSLNLQSQVSIDKTNLQLDPYIDSKLRLNIIIPADFTTGDYSVTITATSLSDEIVQDEEIIDVKVVSKDYIPDYNVSISISPTNLELDQGDSDNITITITNKGNVMDDYTIRFESTDFTSADIQFFNNTLTLNNDDSGQITVTITIPDNMSPGEYTIKFIVESDDASDEVILTVKVIVKDGVVDQDGKDEEDNTMLYASIGIIVIIIIIVLSLLFIFLRKKKGKEEEQVEEEQPTQQLESQVATAPQPVVIPTITPQVVPSVVQPPAAEESLSDEELEE